MTFKKYTLVNIVGEIVILTDARLGGMYGYTYNGKLLKGFREGIYDPTDIMFEEEDVMISSDRLEELEEMAMLEIL